MGDGTGGPDLERFRPRLQSIGLNAYEARAYLVLIGRASFKAPELANRAGVPRQKIYEVLESLAGKGFVRVTREKTKLFSAVEPGLAIPNYLGRRREILERELTDHSRVAAGIVDDLIGAGPAGRQGRGEPDFLRIISGPGQAGAQFREMLAEAREEYVEFCRPPYATAPIELGIVREAAGRGVACRVLADPDCLRSTGAVRGGEVEIPGLEIRVAGHLPIKLAVFDGARGMIGLPDPAAVRPAWRTGVFDHPGMAQAMRGLFEDYWARAAAPEPQPLAG